MKALFFLCLFGITVFAIENEKVPEWASLLITRTIKNEPISGLLSVNDAQVVSNGIQQMLNDQDKDGLKFVTSSQLSLNGRQVRSYLRRIKEELSTSEVQRLAPVKSKSLDQLQPKEVKFSSADKKIMERFSLIFADIPEVYHKKLLTYLQAKPSSWRKQLEESQGNKSERIKKLLMFIGDVHEPHFGEPYYANGYVFFPIDKKQRLRNNIAIERRLSSFTVQKVMGMNPENDDDRELKKKLIEELVNGYKIHLMPAQGTDLLNLAQLLLDEFAQDPQLKNYVDEFKVAVSDYELLRENSMPVVVIYVLDGTKAAQEVLNKLYQLFKKHPEIKGSGEQPRFNGKVTDLIWIAQGDGDSKRSRFNDEYFELPSKIYYRSDLTGTVRNYHLKNPETGNPILT